MVQQQIVAPILEVRLKRTTALVSCAVLATLLTVVSSVQAQTFTVVHTFTGGADGSVPLGSITLDAQGNLYGTASAGGHNVNGCVSFGYPGCGTVFKLTHRGSSWTFSPLYQFQGASDGANPYSGVAIGPDGSLYGTTLFGGLGQGTVYNVRPPARAMGSALGSWSETVLHAFSNGGDGSYPALGTLVFDRSGNMYGTTELGGYECVDGGFCGTMFKLTPSGSDWQESIFQFMGGADGGNPLSGVVLDAAGNLYGTTDIGDFDSEAYQLTPSGSGWTETPLYDFGPFGDPRGGVILDGAVGLYGTTVNGTVYQLSSSGDSWIYSLLYSFSGSSGPWNGVVRDASGNLYGTTCADGTHGQGSVFKLTRSGDSWMEADLYDFTGGADGACPIGGIARDTSGNLFGTTSSGGSGCGAAGCGVIWEITP